MHPPTRHLRNGDATPAITRLHSAALFFTNYDHVEHAFIEQLGELPGIRYTCASKQVKSTHCFPQRWNSLLVKLHHKERFPVACFLNRETTIATLCPGFCHGDLRGDPVDIPRSTQDVSG